MAGAPHRAPESYYPHVRQLASPEDVLVTIRVEPATASRWPDVVAVFGRTASKPDSCWCQRFRQHDAPSNRAALKCELDTATVPVAVLAYVGDQPAGWTRAVPRHTLPGILGNRALQRILDEDDSAWWIACIVIRREHRGQGVGVALLQAAATHARENGASVIDGHPVDVDRLKAKASPSGLFTGTSTMFRAAGFHEVGRTYPSRPIMRMNLT
jgi:GNAT superfamily N-acetyltransferase